jgi:Type II secretion system (T2SS), protein E, N-terminal domain
VADDLTKALLLEDVVAPSALAEALYVSVTTGVPLVQSLTDTAALSSATLTRYLGRTETPFLRHVVPIGDIVDRLPVGLCERLLALPVRRDAVTGTIDVALADAAEPHAATEISFHLQAPVRVVRAQVDALEEGLRRLRLRPSAQPLHGHEPELYDSRPHSSPSMPPMTVRGVSAPRDTLPPSSRTDPSMSLDPAAFHAPPPPRQMHVVPSVAPPRPRRDTPTWGTPVHSSLAELSEPPRSGAPTGSDIPIPLTRRTYSALAGGTQRPPAPAMLEPALSGLDEGPRADGFAPAPESLAALSFIPGPPPLPPAPGVFAARAAEGPMADGANVLGALRAASARDEVLELVLTGARTTASKVALFVVKRGGYLGWTCTPEFGDRIALQSVLVPLDVESVFDHAVREGLFLGPIRPDGAHADLLGVMRTASRDVAVVPVRVSGRAAVVIVADDLGDTMTATRRLEELATAAGDAFARIVRTRR